MTQIIDNLLPRERPLGSYLGDVALKLAQEGVPIRVISVGIGAMAGTVLRHLNDCQSNGLLPKMPDYDWPSALNKIQPKHVVPRRKPAARSRARPKGRKNRS